MIGKDECYVRERENFMITKAEGYVKERTLCQRKEECHDREEGMLC